MGLMDKIKNMFTEEVEDVKPIKKDVIQVEIPAAKPETKKVEVQPSEPEEHPVPVTTEAPKKEEKFVFPVYFDDKDFDELEKPKEKAKPPVQPKEPYNASKQQPPKEVKKTFKPSPVISPVYGILDKNYSKDSIVAKKKSSSEIHSYHATVPTVEDVRRKAFGRLEDELENSLTYEHKQSFFLNEDDEIKQEVDIIDELDLKEEVYHNDDTIDKMIDDHENLQTPTYRHGSVEENMVEEELNKLETKNDKLVESDLFNLIDSMYRGKEDE
jgi:hypothetical protein